MVSINKTKPGELNTLAVIHINSFKSHLNARLGNSYVKAFINWFATQPDAICYTATINNTPSGYVCGAPLGYNQQMNKDLSGIVLLSTLLHPWLLLHGNFLKIAYQKLSSMLSGKKQTDIAIQKLNGKGISLVSICVDKNNMTKGTGTHLIKEFEAEAKNRKFSFMRLSVKKDNLSAIQFYEKNDWQYLCESSKNVLYYYKNL